MLITTATYQQKNSVYFTSPHASEKFESALRRESFRKTSVVDMLLLLFDCSSNGGRKLIDVKLLASNTLAHNLLASFNSSRLLFSASFMKIARKISSKYRLKNRPKRVGSVCADDRRFRLIHKPWRSLSNIKNLLYYLFFRLLHFCLIGINNGAQ